MHKSIKIGMMMVMAALSALAATNDVKTADCAAPETVSCASTNETSKASLSAEETARMAQKVEAWFDARRWHLRKEVDDGGHKVIFRGTMGRFSTFFSQIPFTVCLNDCDNEKIVFYAFLPVSVPKNRRDAVSDMLLRMSKKFGLSTVEMNLDADEGSIHFQAAFPLVSLRIEPDAVLDSLVVPVVEYMTACSEAVARLSLGMGTVDEALTGIEYVSLDMLRTEGTKVYDNNAAAAVLKRHLEKTVSHYETVEMDGLTQFKITLCEMDGPYENLDAYLAVRDGVVFCQCFLPTNVPSARIAEMRRYVMRKNCGMSFSLYTFDPVSGRIGFKYTAPVHLLEMSADDKAVGGECFMLLCYTAYQVNEFAKALPEEFKTGEESVEIPLDQAKAKIDSIVKSAGVGGRPLSQSADPLPYRYANARQAFVERKLGFSKRERPDFPRLAPLKKASDLKLDLAGQFAESVKGHVAQFPEGEIRWTEDGTNGLSLIESDVKIREAQVKCVQAAMKGRACANDVGTVWILNDDFLLGYVIGLNEKRKDDLVFLMMTRRPLGDVPAEVAVILEYIPSQLVLDSVVGAFHGDETARTNLNLLKEAGVMTVVTE